MEITDVPPGTPMATVLLKASHTILATGRDTIGYAELGVGRIVR